MSKVTNAQKNNREKRGNYYVSLYAVDSRYGGPEEGGWWYDYHYVMEYYRCSKSNINKRRNRMLKAYHYLRRPYNVCRRYHIYLVIERKLESYATKRIPRYE